ncbi:hypothetical protein Hanom_Chr10g00964561 [Helianthus anomalus]
MHMYSTRGSHWKQSLLFLWGRGKTVYILTSSDSTFVLLLMGFTEYDDYEFMHMYT